MQTFLDLAIQERLAKYLSGKSSLTAFEDWFAPIAMRVERSGNPAAIDLAHEIELRLAEYTGGYWTEPALRAALAPLVMTVLVNTSGLPRTWTRSSTRAEQIPQSVVSL
jgi:hypothetical protein